MWKLNPWMRVAGQSCLVGGCQGSVAINDYCYRVRDTDDEAGTRFFAVTPLPVDDVFAGVGVEGAPSVEIGAIEHELVRDFAGHGWGWLYVPAPLGSSGEGASAP